MTDGGTGRAAWKTAFGWLATAAIVAAVGGITVVAISTALVGWPWSDPATRSAFQGVLLLGAAFISVAMLMGAALSWGPLSEADDAE